MWFLCNSIILLASLQIAACASLNRHSSAQLFLIHHFESQRAFNHAGLNGSKRESRQDKPPLILDQIRELISVLPDEALAGEIADRGINFRLGEEVIHSLNRMGAGPRTVSTLRGLLANHTPSIVVNAGDASVRLGESLTIFADANDSDGDALQYFWATTDGVIRGGGPTVRLDTTGIVMNSDSLPVTVRVTVSDRKGESVSHSKSITVRQPERRLPSLENNAGSPGPQRVKPSLMKSSWIEGKYVMVSLENEPESQPEMWGFIEVELSQNADKVTLQIVTGKLPGRPCRIDFVSRENVAEFSLKEAPGFFNEWRRIVSRVRPKDSKRHVRFGISWQLI